MKPTLLVLAAGMGSRYGGLKQLDGIGPHGETIMDYSIHDAIEAGFGRIVFVIRKDFEQDFNDRIISKYRDHVPAVTVFQDINDLPEGFSAPEGRVKPWGTGHAILAARKVINEPFAVINADDFYGKDSFRVIAGYLSATTDSYSMVGFPVINTLSESGSVSRGVCTVDSQNKLTAIVECHGIKNSAQGISYNDESGTIHVLNPATPVSMNLWGFQADFMKYASDEFVKFLSLHGSEAKSEFYIPTVVDRLIHSGKKTVDVLSTDSRWFGVTFPEDREHVAKAFAGLHDSGVYPERLF